MFRNFFTAITIVIFSLAFARGAGAHPTQPRVEISIERINPGGVVDIRGVAFDYEEFVQLYLERQGVIVQLGEINADLEGIFIYTASIPVDLPQGVYNIRAVTDHHDILSPPLTVQGQPTSSEEGGQGTRDEDDGLLAPMPTYAPGVVPGGAVQTMPVVQPNSNPTPVPRSTPMFLFAGAILLVLVVFFVFRRRSSITKQ